MLVVKVYFSLALSLSFNFSLTNSPVEVWWQIGKALNFLHQWLFNMYCKHPSSSPDYDYELYH